MTAIQIVIIAFAAFALSRTVLKLRQGEVHSAWAAAWAVLWIGTAVVAVLPQTASWFASILGVGRGADAVVYLSIILLFYVMFRVFVRLERIEHEITLLVREMAMRDRNQAGK